MAWPDLQKGCSLPKILKISISFMKKFRHDSHELLVTPASLGTTALVPGLPLLPPLAFDAVIPARHSLGCLYVTRGLCVVDRTVGACLITCSPRHLTSHLFHSYISTTHSLRPQACIISFLCVLGRYRLRAWVIRQRESHRHRLVAIRVGQDRDSHT